MGTEPKRMTLTRQEMRELEAQDGLADETAARELAGVAEAWNDVAVVLRDALRPPTAPPMADSVMEVVTGLDHPKLLAAGALLGDAVREEAGSVPALWDHVLRGIEAEWQETATLLREAVSAEAGDAHLADAVLARVARPESNLIRLQPSRRTPTAAPRTRRGQRPFVERYLPTIVGMAAAAAFLVVFSTPVQPTGRELAYDLSPVNHVQIEDISGDSDAMVEVLAFGDDAPPIIFIDEGDDSPSTKGTPL
jgi:hypothetical protein